nr:DEAD (Asp-Glu-Ala-Asp) box polypeptide 54 [Cryptomonas curvata]
MFDYASYDNKFDFDICRWLSIFLFEYLKKKKKNIIKNKIFFTRKGFLKFKIKSYFLLCLKKIIKIKNVYQVMLQELRLIINDLFCYSMINNQNYIILKNIKKRYNLYIDLKIGGGKFIIIFFTFINNSWSVGKKDRNFLLFNSILLTLKNKENSIQIIKMIKKSGFIFNHFVNTKKIFQMPKKDRGYGIFFFYFKKKEKSNLVLKLINKKVRLIVCYQSVYEIVLNDIAKISKMLFKLSKKKIQLIYFKYRDLIDRFQFKFTSFFLRLGLNINRDIIMLCIKYSIHFFEKSFSKISKLIYILNKKQNRCIIFLNSKKRCVLLKNILKKYFKKFIPIFTEHIYNNKLSREVYLINNNQLNSHIKISNLDYTLNYDIPTKKIIYLKRFEIFETKKNLNLIFFLVYEIYHYKKFLKMIFGLN